MLIEAQKFDILTKAKTSALERIYLNSFMSLSYMYVILIGIIIFLMWVWAALCMVCSVGRQGLYIAFSPPFPPTLPDMKNMHKNTKTNMYTYQYRSKYIDKRRTFHVNNII